ncbi:hypothetical protein NHH73_14780 [Oxalobacteraceae bacterium OTU3CINTB1]|nr:hypothetical protein NHH73_14780 [Oxalobacteraceae bacterium OTU3CINTB1]
MIKRLVAFCLTTPLLCQAGGDADTSDQPSKAVSNTSNAFEKIAALTQADLAVPASPAFAALGLSPEKIQRPGMTRDFVGSVIRALGADGKLVNGIAVDMSPATVFFRKLITGGTNYGGEPGDHSDFQWKNWPTRVLARTTVSLGTTEADSTGASKVAFGLRVGLIDSGDPGLFADQVSRCLRNTPMESIPAGPTATVVPADAAINLCDPAKDTALALWARPALYAGIGRSWYSRTGKVTQRESDNKVLWLTYSQGIVREGEGGESGDGYRTLIQGHLSRRLNDRYVRESTPDTLLQQNSTEAILRLRTGRSKWHGYFELGRRRVKLEGDMTEKIRHTAVGGEFKLALGDDMWLQLGSVRERGFSDGKDRTALTTNLRIGAAFLNLPGK